MLAWVEYCKFIGKDDNYIERGLLPTMPTNIWKNRCLDSSSEIYANASTSSNQDDSSYSQCSSPTVHGSLAQPTSDEEWEPQPIDVPCYAEDCGSSCWIAQHSMQKELDVVCQRLRLPLAIYKQHQIQLRQGVTFVRYSASIEHNFLGQPPSPCVGRFARSEYDAKEDVAVMLIRHLLHVTGGKIRDFNFYNVGILEDKIHSLEQEKLQLDLEVRLLKEELEHIKIYGKGQIY